MEIFTGILMAVGCCLLFSAMCVIGCSSVPGSSNKPYIVGMSMGAAGILCSIATAILLMIRDGMI